MSKLVLLRGLSTDLDSNSLVDGQILFTEDTNELYIDFLHPETEELIRKSITNKKLAEDLQQFINNLDKVENKSSEDIRNEITYENIIAALGFTPVAEGDSIAASNIDYSNTESGLSGTNVQAALDETVEKLAIAQAHVLTLETEKASKEDVENAIADLVDSAPEELNTLKELATEINNNKDVVELLTEAVGNKVDKIEGKVLSTNDYTTEEKEKLADVRIPFIGTKAEVKAAIAAGEIQEGDIVNITDDVYEEEGSGTVPEGISNIVYLTQEEYDALPESKLTDGIEYRITDQGLDDAMASNIAYDNTNSGMDAITVQGAIDEVIKNSINLINEKFNILRGILTAGQNEIVIENEKITENSILTFYTSVYGVHPTDVLVENGSVTLAFIVMDIDMEVGVRIDG